MYQNFIKRGLDIFISVIAILFFMPVYIVISGLVFCFLGRPVIYKQRRIGKNERPFMLYKFRSMTNEKDREGKLLDERKRLTRFGSMLRSSSLDELPELFSVLKGDMSLIGPRPLPDYYMPYYKKQERMRHKVRGGLIPPDVLSGKPVVSWEEQFKYEVCYANHISFWLDLRIIIYTLIVLIKRIKSNYGSDFRPHLNEYRKG